MPITAINPMSLCGVTYFLKTAKIAPGMRLIREWNGSSYMVEAVDGGFVWNGKRYGSLSAAARAITGARWSGPRFFGLSSGEAR